MRRRGISLVGVAFAVLIALVLVFMLRLTAHRPPAVVLPETGSAQSEGGVIRDEGRSAIRRVEVTPETVQRVIERLARPDNDSRTLTIERYWAGGGGLTNAAPIREILCFFMADSRPGAPRGGRNAIRPRPRCAGRRSRPHRG